MTLILSCITNEYVFQVSDRRLTNLHTERPDPNEYNKAVDFWGRLAFGYTGVARVNNTYIDDWIAKTIIDCSSVYEAINTLKDSASGFFKHFNYKQAFIATGWLQRNLWDYNHPFISVISNYYDEYLNDTNTITDSFREKAIILNEIAGEKFNFFSVPHTLKSSVSDYLNSKLTIFTNSKKLISPLTYINILVKAFRDHSSGNDGIGDNLLALCIPKKAIEADYFHIKDGILCYLYSSGVRKKNSRKFLYYPSNRYKGISYGPNCVFANSFVKGFVSKQSSSNNLLITKIELSQASNNAVLGLFIDTDTNEPNIILGIHPKHNIKDQKIFRSTLNHFLKYIFRNNFAKSYELFSSSAKLIVNWDFFCEKYKALLTANILFKPKFIIFKNIWIYHDHFFLDEGWSKCKIAYTFGTFISKNNRTRDFVCWFEKIDTYWRIHKLSLKEKHISEFIKSIK